MCHTRRTAVACIAIAVVVLLGVSAPAASARPVRASEGSSDGRKVIERAKEALKDAKRTFKEIRKERKEVRKEERKEEHRERREERRDERPRPVDWNTVPNAPFQLQGRIASVDVAGRSFAVQVRHTNLYHLNGQTVKVALASPSFIARNGQPAGIAELMVNDHVAAYGVKDPTSGTLVVFIVHANGIRTTPAPAPAPVPPAPPAPVPPITGTATGSSSS